MKEEKIGVTILTIVFVGLVISLFFIIEPRYTGLAVGTCTDSDDGQDVYVQGTTMDGATNFTDICLDSSNVQEGYCNINLVAITNLPCPAGYSCNNGFCITTTTSTTSSSSTSSSSTSTSSSTTSTISNSTSTTSSSSTSTSSSTTTAQSTSTLQVTSSSLAGSQDEICSPDFQCDPWSQCINGLRTRSCSDINNCGFPDKIERERCTAETSIAQQAVQESNITPETSVIETELTGRVVVSTGKVGKLAASVIWTGVILGTAIFFLNRYKVRWWLKTRHGTGVALENTGDFARSRLIRLRYNLRNWRGKSR